LPFDKPRNSSRQTAAQRNQARLQNHSQLRERPQSVIVNNSVRPTSPQTPLRWSATTFDRREARAMEHEARPPARFSSPLSPQPDNQKPKTAAVRFARGETKVPNLFQDLTPGR
jgi:hypothetical protein